MSQLIIETSFLPFERKEIILFFFFCDAFEKQFLQGFDSIFGQLKNGQFLNKIQRKLFLLKESFLFKTFSLCVQKKYKYFPNISLVD